MITLAISQRNSAVEFKDISPVASEMIGHLAVRANARGTRIAMSSSCSKGASIMFFLFANLLFYPRFVNFYLKAHKEAIRSKRHKKCCDKLTNLSSKPNLFYTMIDLLEVIVFLRRNKLYRRRFLALGDKKQKVEINE